ncbi:MAG: radical SAM family heme chaperone HemW [Pseudomonadota bacterium]
MTDILPGLYIHIPFCIKKCPYCDFYSTDDLQSVSGFIDALEQEIFLYKNRFEKFDTLYFGGGTPTVLTAADIERIFTCLSKHFTISLEPEITIEANPNDITREKFKRLRSIGFNRISLGVQSFDESALGFLNRRHTASEACEAITLLRQEGCSNLSIDLMYAIPGQTMTSWMDTLEQAVSFNPEHLSCYQLTIKEQTPFWNLKEKGSIQPPDEEAQERLFLTTAAFLERHGYIQYEISNFAREEKYFGLHNSKYWQHAPNLGLGPSAHSFFDATRWWNFASVRQYIHMLQSSASPVEGSEKISGDQLLLESLFLQFRTSQGVDLEMFKKIAGAEKILDRLVQAKLVTNSGTRVMATKQGLLVADSLPLLFV